MSEMPPVVQDGVTAGTLLRRAREAAGLHVAAVAVSLKVPVRKLEALEDDRYDDMPDAVFVRALASSVCRALKTDPQPILDRLPQTAAPRLVRDTDGLNAPFRAPSDGAPPGWREHLKQPVFLAVFALLLAALVLILLPGARKDEQPVAQAQPAPAPATAVVVETPPVPASPPQVAASTAPAVADPVTVAAAPAATVAAAVAASGARPLPLPPAGIGSGPTVAGSAGGIVTVRAKGESWVEVTDAKGAVALRRLLASGEAAGASGALPLQVVIGRVDATEVQVRGKPYDLRPVSRDNVARFEVK